MENKGRLFLCATPIGNLMDITLRVLETLKKVDLIACEDTRHTLKLLNHFEINKPVTSYFEHNKHFKGEKIIQELLSGKNVALVTDAGMPGISDPGEDLIKRCIEKGIEITALPGAVAAVTGLVLSGFDTKRFVFEGFLPRNKKEKRKFLRLLVQEERTLILYEAPHRLLDTLNEIYSIFGERRVAICRELTKKFEEVIRGNISEILQDLEDKNIKGEFTIIIEGAKQSKPVRDIKWALEKVEELLEKGYSSKEAVKIAAKESEVSKRELYNLVMIKKDSNN